MYPEKLHKTLGGADDFVALLLILPSNLESLEIIDQPIRCARLQWFMMFEKLCGLHGGHGKVWYSLHSKICAIKTTCARLMIFLH